MDGLWILAGLVSSPTTAVFLHLAVSAVVFLIYGKAAQLDRPRDLFRHGLPLAWLAGPICSWLSLQLTGGLLAGALGPGPAWLPYLWGVLGALAAGGLYYGALRAFCLERTLLEPHQKGWLALWLALGCGPLFFLCHLAQAKAITAALELL